MQPCWRLCAQPVWQRGAAVAQRQPSKLTTRQGRGPHSPGTTEGPLVASIAERLGQGMQMYQRLLALLRRPARCCNGMLAAPWPLRLHRRCTGHHLLVPPLSAPPVLLVAGAAEEEQPAWLT